MGYIYKITNIQTNKCYIGITTKKDPIDRWKSHKYSIRYGNGCPLLMNAFKKYGEEAFQFEILLNCVNEKLYDYEKEYIKIHNTLSPNGYNLHEGGEFGGNFLGRKHSDDTKQVLRLKSREYNNREDVKEKARKRAIEFNKTHNISSLMKQSEKWQKYVKEKKIGSMSTEIKMKISNSLKNYYKNNDISYNRLKHSEIMTKINGKKVNQYSKDNEFISSFDSIVLAANNTDIGRRNIQANLSNRSKTAGGFVWKYADKEPDDKELNDKEIYI